MATKIKSTDLAASLALTGVPTAPTAAGGTNTTQISTTAFAKAEALAAINANPLYLSTNDFGGTGLIGAPITITKDSTPTNGSNHPIESNAVFDGLALKADLISPALTGVPTAPTASLGNSTTQLATTAFVIANAAAGTFGYELSATFAAINIGNHLHRIIEVTSDEGNGSAHTFYVYDGTSLNAFRFATTQVALPVGTTTTTTTLAPTTTTTTTAVPGLEALIFTSASGFTESPTGVWNGGSGVATKSIASSTDGWIEAEYANATDNREAYIGLSTDNTETLPPLGYTIAIASDGTYESFNTAFTDIGSYSVAAVVGDKYRLKRTGANVTAEYFRSSVWTVLQTFAATTTAQLFLKGSARFDQFLTNPKGDNVS